MAWLALLVLCCMAGVSCASSRHLAVPGNFSLQLESIFNCKYFESTISLRSLVEDAWEEGFDDYLDGYLSFGKELVKPPDTLLSPKPGAAGFEIESPSIRLFSVIPFGKKDKIVGSSLAWLENEVDPFGHRAEWVSQPLVYNNLDAFVAAVEQCAQEASTMGVLAKARLDQYLQHKAKSQNSKVKLAQHRLQALHKRLDSTLQEEDEPMSLMDHARNLYRGTLFSGARESFTWLKERGLLPNVCDIFKADTSWTRPSFGQPLVSLMKSPGTKLDMKNQGNSQCLKNQVYFGLFADSETPQLYDVVVSYQMTIDLRVDRVVDWFKLVSSYETYAPQALDFLEKWTQTRKCWRPASKLPVQYSLSSGAQNNIKHLVTVGRFSERWFHLALLMIDHEPAFTTPAIKAWSMFFLMYFYAKFHIEDKKDVYFAKAKIPFLTRTTLVDWWKALSPEDQDVYKDGCSGNAKDAPLRPLFEALAKVHLNLVDILFRVKQAQQGVALNEDELSFIARELLIAVCSTTQVASILPPSTDSTLLPMTNIDGHLAVSVELRAIPSSRTLPSHWVNDLLPIFELARLVNTSQHPLQIVTSYNPDLKRVVVTDTSGASTAGGTIDRP